MTVKQSKIGIGLYGSNGHTIEQLLQNHFAARLVAIADFDHSRLPALLQNDESIRQYDTLEDMLCDEDVELVSLCSSQRGRQALHAALCMEAGKNVYAEKPCALNEAELDMLIETSARTKCRFHEMAGTVYEQPYLAMSKIVRSGILGKIIQVHVQKSYPSCFDKRPQDEYVDGGLLRQAGVHGLRFIEHITGIKIKEIDAFETCNGNPVDSGGLSMAASVMMLLENDGVATMSVNYLNPTGFGRWGNEEVRVFGSHGFIESVDGGARTRLVVENKDYGPLHIDEPSKEYFDFYINELLGIGEMPFSLEDELHPTRMVLRAKLLADQHNMLTHPV